MPSTLFPRRGRPSPSLLAIALLVFSATLGATPGLAQSSPEPSAEASETTPTPSAGPSPIVREALSHLQQEQWQEASDLLETHLETRADDGAAWYRLAQARRGLENWEGSLEAVRQAAEHSFPNRAALTVVEAEAQAALGDTAKAFELLEEAAAAGSNRPLLGALERGDGFSSLTSDPRWEKVLETLTPCTSEPYRQFDFWIGEFEVVHPVTGQVLGENSITEQLGGCMLLESWRGASGMHGMSMNFYDPEDGTWNQVFVDNNGTPSNWPWLKGNLAEDGSMVLLSPEGDSQSRWTWTPIDERTVRQKAESTSDGGKTWQVVWDSHYVREN